jgi:hypothetical protein
MFTPQGKTNINQTQDMKNENIAAVAVIRCLVNRGGKHLKPYLASIHERPTDGIATYGKPIAENVRFGGELLMAMRHRGDLIQLPGGDWRVTRDQHIGKEIIRRRVAADKPKEMLVLFYLHLPAYVLFTKRTGGAKLRWLLRQCEDAGLRVLREGRSWHAPTTWVHRYDEGKAWEILNPVDDIPDDDPQFSI